MAASGTMHKLISFTMPPKETFPWRKTPSCEELFIEIILPGIAKHIV
jgi:hypothetical protein